MKIETAQVTKITLTDLLITHRLDPITIILEDYAPWQGKIIVECYGQSWSTFFGSMGEPIANFCASVSADYLANRFYGGPHSVNDFDSMKAMAIKEVIKMRRQRDLSADDARDLFDEINDRWPETEDEAWYQHGKMMVRLFGDDWHCQIPQKTSEEYQYVLRTVRAVQEGLAMYVKMKQGATA